MSAPARRPGPFAPENRRWWTLAALTVALFMTMLDNLVVNVALPSIQEDLGSSASALQWMVSGYALTYGVLMLPGGELADLLGRRRIFLAGLAIFTVASLACGLAQSTEMLLAGRVVQGVGAGLMMPATLAIIPATFSPEERGAAIGIWAGVSWMGVAVAPLVGGVLTEQLSWNWIFYINLPIGVLGFAAGYFLIPESKNPAKRGLDIPGLIAVGGALFAVTFALIDANSRGWGDPLILSLFAAFAVLLVGFVLLERSRPDPMLPLSIFSNKIFSGAATTILLTGVAMFGVIFFVSIFLQDVLGYSAIKTGATFMPMTVLSMIVAPIAGQVADRIGGRWLMTAGLLIVAVGLVFLARLDAGSSFGEVLVGLMLIGGGTPLVMTPGTATGLGSAPFDKAGIAAALITTSSQLGGALGIAAVGAVVIARANDVAATGASGTDAFVAGFERGLYVAAAVAVVGAVVAALTIRRVRRMAPGGPPPDMVPGGPERVSPAPELLPAPARAPRVAPRRTGATVAREVLGSSRAHPFAPVFRSPPWLLGRQGAVAGYRFEVAGTSVLGREGDIVVEDPEVSRRHAVVRAVEGALVVEDLQSLNGTWVNGDRVGRPTTVQPGDTVRLGKTVLEVRA